MKDHLNRSQRRDFLKAAGLASLSFMLPGSGMAASGAFPAGRPAKETDKFSAINFFSDGLNYTPEEYLETLLAVNKDNIIGPDFYSQGGATTALEEAFARLTGKEKAVFLPTGTMANEVAISLLAGDRAKIVVPENSHIYRDEADAAQVVHNKRLIPAGKGQPYYDVEELDRVINYHREGEVFKSDVGAVAVECPVRRADGTAVPIEVIRNISTYCRQNGYGLHLDGARLHLASAWTGIPIDEYAAHFDTVYISQYKYLNAAFGGVLCGPAALIDQLPLLAKLHGGAVFQTWVASAMSLHHLNTIEDDLQKVRQAADKLILRLNALGGLKVTPIPAGTNIYSLEAGQGADLKKISRSLYERHNIWLRVADDGTAQLKMNASLLRKPLEEIVEAWSVALND